MTTFYTSGKNGRPKAYALTDEQMSFRVSMMSDASRGTGFENLKSIFVDFAPTSYIGSVYAEYAKQKGIACHFASLGSIEATVELFKREKIEGITTTPVGMYNYANAVNGNYKFDWMLASMARLSPGLSKLVRASMGDNLWSSYACCEAGIISIVTGQQIEATPGCVGTVVPGVTVGFDNNEIRVQSDMLIDGYVDSTLTSQHFKDGWYYTGDLGHMSDGLLFFDGRKDR